MKKSDIIFWLLIILMVVIVICFNQIFSCFIVESGSMEPELNIGEFIIVKESSEYELGDIITFYEHDFEAYVTHRIIGIDTNKKFITKGDFNNTVDENSVNQKNIVGKVVFHSKVLGLVFYEYKKLTIAILIVFLIIINLLKWR